MFTEFPILARIPKLRKRNFFASGCAILLTVREIGQVLLAHHLRNFVICAKMRNPVNKLIAQKMGYNDLSPMQSTKLDRAKPATTPSLASPRKVSTKNILEAMSQSSDEVESDASSGVKPAKRSQLPSSGSGLQCTTLYNVHFILFSLKRTFPSYADFESDEQNSEFDTKSYLS